MNLDSETPVPARPKIRYRITASILIAAGLVLSMTGAEPAPAPPTTTASRSAWSGVFSAEQVKRGRTFYNSECARCHGETLGGGEDSPALVDKEFLKTWYGKSLADLVEYTREEMPSDGPGKVTRKQSTDVTVFVLSKNGFPTGENELPPDLDLLKKIEITPKK
jgi:S-disulfanyl-L-cysteine oxidoreductase SoxD